MTRPLLSIAMHVNGEENEEAYSRQGQDYQNERAVTGFFDRVEQQIQFHNLVQQLDRVSPAIRPIMRHQLTKEPGWWALSGCLLLSNLADAETLS